MHDSYKRKIDYLRISVTDRCNARCLYCMPEKGIKFIPHTQILSYEEIIFIAMECAKKGIEKIRLTGGEPLVRKGIANLVKGLKSIPGIKKVYITTNGIELEEQLESLFEAGIDGINISLDTLDEKMYSTITRIPQSQKSVEKILKAIDATLKKPSIEVKINCVPSGINDTQLSNIAKLAKDKKISVRFIELMPIGYAKEKSLEFRSQKAVKNLIEKDLGPLIDSKGDRYSYFTLPLYKGKIGFISPLTHPFCKNCNRLRLTSDGYLKPCLQYESTFALKPLLQRGFTQKAQKEVSLTIDKALKQKPFRNSLLETHTKKKTIEDHRTMNQIGG